MIVAPDFTECWEMRTLVRRLDNDEAAPVYVLRLWGHCQNRAETVFELSAENLAAICRYTGDAAKFEAAMAECKYVLRTGDTLEVLRWAHDNRSLIAARLNGKKGGRPAKPKDEEAEKVPTKTHGLTDKSREEKKGKTTPKPLSPAATVDSDDLGPLPPTEPSNVVELKATPADEVFVHWQTVMKHPRAKLDDKGRKTINAMLKAGYSVDDLKDAVVGCSRTPHNMGKNERNTRYDGIGVIFRSADQVQRFIAASEQPVRDMRGPSARLTGANYQRGI